MTGQDAPLPPPRSPRKRLQQLSVFAGSVVVVVVAIVVRSVWGPEPAGADQPAAKRAAKPAAAAAAKPAAPPAEEPKMQIMAVVNGQQITRSDLARECLTHYGKDVLESLVNKHLIAEHCRQRNVVVTTKEVDAEIVRMAERFGLPTDQWLTMLKDERNITPAQYAKDIIWPTIALRKLADSRLEVTQQDLREAYETQFGPAVQARVITCSSLEKAREAQKLVRQSPGDFGNIAKERSEDAGSASAKGLVQPIRKHVGDPKIEQIAFQLKEGEISDVIAAGGQFVILKCEAQIPARKVPMDQVEKLLTDAIRDRKLRLAAKDVFEELQKSAVVENIFNDPQRRAANPGVAATINSRAITMQELAEECVERHGVEVLGGLINHRLLEQACKRRKVQITQQDTDAEVARSALLVGKKTPDGKPDVSAWLKQVTEEQGMSLEVYLHEVVWPTVALKKLVSANVQVTDEDLKKGYEANYGPRVRCRAVVLNQQRRAQEVWDLARKIPAVEKLAKATGEGGQALQAPAVKALIDEAAKQFGKLASQYSIEAGSSVLEGEVPPLQRHGGQPLLEEEAFSLRPGELSGIVQVGDKFVILFCEGRTEPVAVKFDEVRNLIYEDVFEKKIRLAMADEFTKIQEDSQIDNYLAGTTQSSKKDQELLKRAAQTTNLEEIPETAVRPKQPTPRPAPPRR